MLEIRLISSNNIRPLRLGIQGDDNMQRLALDPTKK